MKTDKTTPPVPKPLQTLLALSLLFQVKDKLTFQQWMVAREIVDANEFIFKRIAQAILRDYNLEVTRKHLHEAVVMLLVGLKIDIIPRPK